MRDSLVLYHAACADGFCAAWVWRTFFCRDAEFHAIQYGDDICPGEVAGRDVAILDFSFKRDVLLELKAEARSLLVLDHHVTAQEELKGLDFCVFDMNKSGARLTWDYICGQRGHDADVDRPFLVDYTEDRDLWRFSLPDSDLVTEALRSYPRTFVYWDQLHASGLDLLRRDGTALVRMRDLTVDRAVRRFLLNPTFCEIGGHRVPTVNATYFISEIAHGLAMNNPFAACFFVVSPTRYVYSLRSREDGLDVSEIARRYGGGGHVHAAGFSQESMLEFEGSVR